MYARPSTNNRENADRNETIPVLQDNRDYWMRAKCRQLPKVRR